MTLFNLFSLYLCIVSVRVLVLIHIIKNMSCYSELFRALFDHFPFGISTADRFYIKVEVLSRGNERTTVLQEYQEARLFPSPSQFFTHKQNKRVMSLRIIKNPKNFCSVLETEVPRSTEKYSEVRKSALSPLSLIQGRDIDLNIIISEFISSFLYHIMCQEHKRE